MFGIFVCFSFLLWVSRFSSFSVHAHCLFSVQWDTTVKIWPCFPLFLPHQIFIYMDKISLSPLFSALCPFACWGSPELQDTAAPHFVSWADLLGMCPFSPPRSLMKVSHHQPPRVSIPLLTQPWEPRSSATVQSTYLAHPSLIELWEGSWEMML